MSKYLTIIPWLREVCFPPLPFLFEDLKKNLKHWLLVIDSGKLEFLCCISFSFVLFFGRKCDLGYQHVTTLFSTLLWEIWYLRFPSSTLSVIHYYVFPLFLLLVYSFDIYYVLKLWNKQLLTFSSCFFLYCSRRRSHHFQQVLSHCHSLRSRTPFQPYSSQWLPVLSKCYRKVFQWDESKYVYINRGEYTWLYTS